jgi:hypothetical protein
VKVIAETLFDVEFFGVIVRFFDIERTVAIAVYIFFSLLPFTYNR